MKQFICGALLVFCCFFTNKIAAQCTLNAGNDTAVCQNTTLSIIAQKSGTTNILWTSNPSSGIIGSSTNPTVNVNTSAAGKISLIVTGNAGACADTILVTVNPLPAIPIFTFNAASNQCSGTPITFAATAQAGINYSWAFGDGSTASGASVTHIYNTTNGNSTTPFTITLTATTASGCTTTSAQTINVKQKPDALLVDLINSPQFIFCGGGTFSLNVADGSLDTYSNYSISWGDGTPNYNSISKPAASPPITHVYGSLGFNTISYTVNNANGCTNTSTYNSFNGANPQVGLANPGNTTGLCIPATLSFPITNVAGNAPGTFYIVTTNDGSKPDTLYAPLPASYVHQFTTSSCGSTSPSYQNSFYVKIEAVNPCSRSSATVEPITTNAAPTPNFIISPDTLICQNSIVTFTNTSFGGNWINGQNQCDSTKIINWVITPNTGYVVSTGSLGSPMPIVSLPATWGSNSVRAQFTTAGTYTIKLFVRTKSNCGYDSVLKTICIQSPPVPAFTTTPLTGCAPLTVNCTNTSVNLNQCGIVRRFWKVTKTTATCMADSAADYVFVNATDTASQDVAVRFNNQGIYTIQLTLTNSCGPVSTTVSVVTIKRKPQLVTPVFSNICVGGTITAGTTPLACGDSISSYKWVFTDGNPASSSLQNPGAIIFGTAGTKSISLTVTNSCGISTVNTSVIVLPLPIVNAGNDKTFCSGSSTVIGTAAVVGLTYQWQPVTGLNNPNSANPTLSLTNTGSVSVVYTYVLTATNGANCSANDTVLITVNPLPSIQVNSAVICMGSSATLTASGADSYIWTPSTNLSAATGASVTASPTNNTTYTVTGTLAATGCSANALSLVTINPLPAVNAGSNIGLCNQPIPYQLSGFTPAGGVWTGPGVTPGGIFTPSGTGSFLLTYSYTNLNTNCSNSASITVSVTNPQKAIAGSAFSTCINNSSITLTGFSPAGGTWSGSGITGNTFNPQTAGVGSHVLIYSYGSGTCISRDSLIANVNQSPVITVNNAVFCAGGNALLTANGADSYTWTPAAGLNTTTGAVVTAIPTASTTYIVTGTVTATGCSNTAFSYVTVNALPVVNAGTGLVVCNQSIPIILQGFSPSGGTWSGTGVTASGTFTPSVTGNIILTYTYTNPSTNCSNADTINISVVNPQTANAGTGFNICFNATGVTLTGYTPVGGVWSGNGVSGNSFTPAVAGVGQHILTYSFGSGTCLTTDTILVNVINIPVVTVNNASICAGDSVLISAAGADTYLWSPSTFLSASTGTSVIATPVSTIKYTVTGTINTTGCYSTAQSIVTIKPLPVVNAGGNQFFCNQPVPVSLGGSPTNGSWSGSVNVTSSGIYTPNGVGTFKLYYTVTASNACSNNDSILVKVSAPQTVNAGSDTAICFNSKAVQLSAIPALGRWSGSSLVTTGGLFTPSQSGSFNLIYSIGAGSCLRSDTLIMTVNALPKVSISPSLAICINTSTNLNAGGAVSYSWFPAAGLNTSMGLNVIASPSSTSIYIVTGTDQNGCTNRAMDTVTVNPNAMALFIPADTLHCPPFIIDAATIGLQPSFANSNYLWYANNNLIGNGQIFPGYTIAHENDSVNIKLVTTSIFGCKSDSISHHFYTPFLPHPTFTLSDSVGCGPLSVGVNNTTPNGSRFSYKWNFGNGQTSSLQNPGTINYLPNPTYNDTVYMVSLSVFSGCDTVRIMQTIRVKSKPKALFTPSKTIGCSPMTVIFTNTSKGLNNTYNWNFGDGNTLSTTSSQITQHTYHTAITDTFKVKLIVSNNCGSDSMVYLIIIAPNNINLNFAVNGTDHNGCVPHTVAFFNNSPGGSTFNWDFGDGNILSTTAATDTVYHTYLSAGIFTVKLVAANSCTDTATTDKITVFPKPTAAFIANKYLLCKGDSVQFINQSDSATSYLWQFGDGTTSVLLNPVHIYAIAGFYNVQLTVSRVHSPGNICTDIVQKTINIQDSQPGFFTASDTISNCAPLTVTFVNKNQPSVTTRWNFGDGTSGTGDSVVHTFNNSGQFNVSLIVTVPGGCTYNTNRTVRVNGPSGTFTYVGGYRCFQEDIRFEASATRTNNFLWDFGDGTTLVTTQGIVYHHYTLPGLYLPALMLKNTGGCSYPVQGIDTIKIDRVDGGFTTLQQKVCGATTVLFTDSSHTYFGTAQLQWNLGDGNKNSGHFTTQTYLADGTYPIQLIVTSHSGCSDTVNRQLPVMVNSIPVISIKADGVQCSGVPVTFNSNIQSTDSINISNWSLSNGVNANGSSLIYTFPLVGTFEARLIVGTVNGCYDTAYHNILINLSPNVSAGVDVVLCKGNSTQLSVSGNTQFQWSPLQGLSCINCSNPIANPLVTTPYVVQCVNAAGCVAFDTIVVTVIQPLVLRVSPQDTICIGQSVNLWASGAASYAWSPAQGLNSTTSPSPVATPLITTNYRVVGYDGYNCFTDTAFIVVSVGLYPAVTLGADVVLPSGSIFPLSTSIQNGPILQWLWTPANDLSCANCALPSAYIRTDISYSVKVISSFGCAAMDTINIKVFCENAQVYIPNAFSPDGDGINDILMVRGKGIQVIKSFRIFNRWGEVVFERNNFPPNDPAFGWDGKIKGVVGEPAVYVYTAEAICENGAAFTYKGNTTILK